jgi:hypothetical protein
VEISHDSIKTFGLDSTPPDAVEIDKGNGALGHETEPVIVRCIYATQLNSRVFYVRILLNRIGL